MKKILIALVAVTVLGITASSAKTAAERYADEMAKYDRTDTFERCIRHNAIKRTKVLDNNHIIFEMRNKKVYLNTLSHTCHSLGFSRKFAMTVRNNSVCNIDIITVLDSFLGSRGACGLGKFELLEKRAESDS